LVAAVAFRTIQIASPAPCLGFPRRQWPIAFFNPEVEDDVHRSITIAIIVAAAAIAMAWSVSTSRLGSANKMGARLGGGSAVPMHTFVR
jgi:hypothetical protein